MQGKTVVITGSNQGIGKASALILGSLGARLVLVCRTGDKGRVDLQNRRVDVLLSDEEIERRRQELKPVSLTNHSPWQELYRQHVGQLETGGCLEFAVNYRDVRSVVPRHSH